MFAVITLHMIAASILLNTDVTTRTLESKFKIHYWKYHNHVEVYEITLCILLALEDWWFASGCSYLYPGCYDPQKNTSTREHQNYCLPFCSPFFQWLSSKCPQKPAIHYKLHLVANYATARTTFLSMVSITNVHNINPFYFVSENAGYN